MENNTLQSVTPPHSSKTKRVLIAGVLLLLIILFVGTYFFNKNQGAGQKLALTTSPATTPLLIQMPFVDTSNWKVHYVPDYILIKYPSNWTIKLSTPGASFNNPYNQEKFAKVQDIELKGREGSVGIFWADQWGGACGEPYFWRQIIVNNSILDVCNGVSEGREIWNNISVHISRLNGFGFGITSNSNSLSEKDKQTILGILSTIRTF